MPNSGTVTAGSAALASQYNNLRADVLNTSTGHTHTGASENGARVEGTALKATGVTDGYLLTADGSGGVAWEVLSGAGADVQEFTSSGSWVKPAGKTAVYILAVGGGGGGASGSRGTTGNRGGGGGGHGGNVIERFIPASSLAGTVTITIGAGGAGGTAFTSNGGGANGAVGGTSSFGTVVVSSGGGGGGTCTDGDAISALMTWQRGRAMYLFNYPSANVDYNGGAAPTTQDPENLSGNAEFVFRTTLTINPAARAGYMSPWGHGGITTYTADGTAFPAWNSDKTAGGGGGGGSDTSCVGGKGGNGFKANITNAAGGGSAAAGSAALAFLGCGGGGGGASHSSNAGAGGAGYLGGGGGGGGAAKGAYDSGAGGAGGGGYILVISV